MGLRSPCERDEKVGRIKNNVLNKNIGFYVGGFCKLKHDGQETLLGKERRKRYADNGKCKDSKYRNCQGGHCRKN